MAAHWQSLKLGLPVVPVHDLLVKDGDLVAATHGRGFWILDNVALLRQFDATSLNDPRASVRARNHRAFPPERRARRADLETIHPGRERIRRPA